MAEPTTGPIGPWLTVEDVLPPSQGGTGCCGGLADPADLVHLEKAIVFATEILFDLTGRQYPGVGTRVVRPCRGVGGAGCGCGCGGGEGNGWGCGSGALGVWGGWNGWVWNSALGGWNSSFPYASGLLCGCDGGCNGCVLPEVVLSSPVVSIDEVVIDGEIVDPSEYAIMDYRALVRKKLNSNGCLVGWPCFPAGTLVWTSTGLKPIEAIEAGEMVLTHRNRWRRVTRAGKTGDSETVTVKGRGGVIHCTPDHQFYARETWKQAKVTKLAEPSWVEAHALVGKLWAMPTSSEHLDPVIPEGFMIESRTEAFWWLVGRWLGDGWTGSRGPTNRAYRIYVCCAHDERSEIQDRLDELGWCWNQDDSRTVTKFTYCNQSLWEWLRGEFGHGAQSKEIPAWVMSLPEDHRAALLDGYVSADGSIHETTGGGTIVQTSTVSHRLALGVKWLASSLGYAPTFYRYEFHNDVIEGRTVQVQPSYHVKWMLTEDNGTYPRKQSWIEDDRLWGRVKSVDLNELIVPVYDIEVEDDHSFVAEGMIVHNCKNVMSRDAAPYGVDPNDGSRDHTWRVTYQYGRGPGPAGVIAAAKYACELAKLLCNAADETCELPYRVQTVVREGLTLSFVDPSLFITNGMTGLPLVDGWIRAKNPNANIRRSSVTRLGAPSRNLRSFTG